MVANYVANVLSVTWGRVSILPWDWGWECEGVGGLVKGGRKNSGTFLTSLQLAFRGLDGNSSLTHLIL